MSTSTIRTRALLIAISAAIAGSAAARTPARPRELTATIATARLDGMSAFLAAAPGAHALTQAMVDTWLAREAGVPSLDGFDRSAPIYLLLVDRGGAALVGKIGDRAALTGDAVLARDGWAAIGPAPVVAKVGAYALATLPSEPAVSAPTATVYAASALARYRGELLVARLLVGMRLADSDQASAAFALELDALGSIATDTDRAIITIDADADAGAIDVALVPKRGSRLAAFVAAQAPSDFGLLDDLPATTAGALVAGRLAAGPYRDDLLAAMSALGESRTWRGAMRALMRASTGELATVFVLSTSGASVSEVIGVADPRAAERAIAGLSDARDRPARVDAVKIGWRATTAEHDGVTVRGVDADYDLRALPSLDQAWMIALLQGYTAHTDLAAFDHLAAITSGPQAADQARLAIDAARRGGGYAPTAELAALIAASRARKDSAIVAVDASAIGTATGDAPMPGSTPVALSLGFADGAAHVRVTMPTATLRALLSRGTPAPARRAAGTAP